MGKWIDITGQRFGHLVAQSYQTKTLSSGRKMSGWIMRCDCGSEVHVMTVNLTKGHHQTCGKKCPLFDHGIKGSLPDGKPAGKHPLHRVYHQMRNRCGLPTAPNYPWYGARGVRVCDRWRNGEDGRTGFACFLEDMGERPDGLTLDREDTDGDYEPGNCRWATWTEQQNNRRDTRRIEAFGERRTIAEWSRISGVSQRLIADRMSYGWSVEDAVSVKPLKSWSRHAEHVKRNRASGSRSEMAS